MRRVFYLMAASVLAVIWISGESKRNVSKRTPPKISTFLMKSVSEYFSFEKVMPPSKENFVRFV